MISPPPFVICAGAFEVSLCRKDNPGQNGQLPFLLPTRHVHTEGDIPGDVLLLPDGPHRALGRVRYGRVKHVLGGAGRERRTEDGLHGEREERDDGGELSEHGCCRRRCRGRYVHEEQVRVCASAAVETSESEGLRILATTRGHIYMCSELPGARL